MTVTPELLAAYADGELDADSARLVEAEIADDIQLQADLAAHRALRARLSAHFAPLAEQPVPAQLRQALFADEAEAIDFATEAHKRRARPAPVRWMRFAGPALAASLVLALVGLGIRGSGDYAAGELATALDRQLVATQQPNAKVRVMLSFRNKQGHYCRGFSDETRSGIACRDSQGWRLLKSFPRESGGSTEYQQAGSAGAALMTQTQEMAEGPALDADEEASAARGGWQASAAR